ncbi:hypothetical protein EV1_025317 [Malus domestica]
MHFFLLQSLFPFLLIASFLSINVELSLCQNDQQFINYSSDINCGGVGGIYYPFWGVNRASYCGQPGYEVQCLDNVPVFNMTVSFVYYLTRPVTVDQASSVSCTHEAIVPVYTEAALTIEAATEPSQTIVTDAVEGGFSLQLEIDNDECNKCLDSGGRCGLNTTSNSGFSCFYANRAYASICNGTSNSSRSGGTSVPCHSLINYAFEIPSLLFVLDD